MRIMEVEDTPSVSDDGRYGYLSGFGSLISGAGHFYLGRDKNDSTIGPSTLPDRFAEHPVIRDIFIAGEILLCAAAAFLSIEASPLFVSCWFLGLLVPCLFFIPSLVSSFSVEKTNENDEETLANSSPPPEKEQVNTKNESEAPSEINENDEASKTDFDILQSGIKNINSGANISDSDYELIKFIVDSINFEKPGCIELGNITKYEDLWQITNHDSCCSKFAFLLPKTDDQGCGPRDLKVDDIQVSILRLICLAAHFGNSSNPAVITVRPRDNFLGFNILIQPAKQWLDYRTHTYLCSIPLISRWEASTVIYCVCTGSDRRMIQQVRTAYAQMPPQCIFVENIYDKNENGTIQIQEKSNGKPAEIIKTWKAKKSLKSQKA